MFRKQCSLICRYWVINENVLNEKQWIQQRLQLIQLTLKGPWMFVQNFMAYPVNRVIGIWTKLVDQPTLSNTTIKTVLKLYENICCITKVAIYCQSINAFYLSQIWNIFRLDYLTYYVLHLNGIVHIYKKICSEESRVGIECCCMDSPLVHGVYTLSGKLFGSPSVSFLNTVIENRIIHTVLFLQFIWCSLVFVLNRWPFAYKLPTSLLSGERLSCCVLLSVCPWVNSFK